MWALMQNNPVMVSIIIVVVLVAIVLHVGIYVVIKRLMNHDAPEATDE
jgi:hypothetical protein